MAKDNIIISTGDLKQEYEILDTIFAADSHSGGFFSSSVSPSKAFEGVKEQLEKECKKLGGNAVINCQFEYRNAVTEKGIMGGSKHVIEIFAYGTVVKF